MKCDEQLCWGCKNATGLCPWSHDGEEIEGWKAEKTVIPGGAGREDIPSYKITECPMFEPDERRSKRAGTRMTVEDISKIIGVKPRTVKTWDDEKVLFKLKAKGIKAKVLHKGKRIFVFKGRSNDIL
jgi:hypothetical protein